VLDLPRDPWLWPDLSPEQLVELAEQCAGAGPESPFFQYCAVRTINRLKPEIEAGSGFDVLAAVRDCGTHGLVMPLWLVRAFNRRYDAVLSCRASSWDDPQSFGRPYPKGAHLNALRKARTTRFAVFNAVRAMLKSEYEPPPIDKALFEQVGSELGVGGTLAEEYYYSVKKMWDAWGRPSEVKANTAKNQKIAGLRKRPR
jgi:hypothetical protein